MTTYYVLAGAAGADGTLPTLNAAARLVEPGDVVEILPGVYRERLVCNQPRVTWRSVEPGAAVIDGGWNGQAISSSPAQISVGAAGVVLDGLAVQDSPGDGIGVGKGAHGARILRCSTDRTYSGGIILNAGEPLRDVLVSECAVLRAGMSWEAGVRPRVSGSMNLVRAYNCVVERCKVAYGRGEGINIDKGSYRSVVRDCTIFDNAHLCLYFNRAQECVAENNLLYLTGLPERNDDDDAPGGIIIGDECGGNADGYEFGRGNVVRGNLVVNCGTLFGVRNNRKPDGYRTHLDGDTLVERNTFVAGPLTRKGLHILENLAGRPHGAAMIRENVIHWSLAPAGASMATNQSAAIVWQRNGWEMAPPPSCAGEGDVVGFDLVAPGAPLASAFPAGEVTADRNHYRPTALSPLVGAGADGATLGALSAASEEPPEPPAWRDELEAARAALVRLAGELTDLGGALGQMGRALAAAETALPTATDEARAALEALAATLEAGGR